MTNRWANIWFSSLVIVGCFIFGYIALGFENPSALAGSQVPTQVFPLALLGFTAVCSALNILFYLKGDPEDDADQPLDFNLSIFIRIALIIAILVAVWLLWDVVGFIPVAILMCVGIAAVMQVRSPLVYIGLAIYGPIIWAIFKYGIGIEL